MPRAAPHAEDPPQARLRSYDPFLLPLSVVFIVAAAGALLYVFVALHVFKLAALLVLGVPLAIYGVAQSFLPTLLTADENEIRRKQPFRAAQTVRRRDVVRIEQRVIGDSSYASFLDRQGRERLFVAIFTPAQIASFGAAANLPIREVTEAPPPSAELEAADQRSDAEGKRAYWLTFSGSLAVIAIGVWIFVAVMLDQDHQSLTAYRSASTCASLATPNQDCRYRTTAIASALHVNRSGKPAMTLTFAADVVTSGPPRMRKISLVSGTSPTLEEGATVQVEIWRRDLVTQVNGTETSDFSTLESNANGGWLLLALACLPLGAIGLFIWQWRSKPA